jgi:hypothetical protein
VWWIYLSNMKIIISESQFYNLIPSEVKRRLEEVDMENIDKIIKMKYKGKAYWTYNDNFDSYLNTVISDSLETFIFNKYSDYEGDWMTIRNDMRKILQGMIPYLKKKYNNETKAYYKKMRS